MFQMQSGQVPSRIGMLKLNNISHSSSVESNWNYR